jgi:orotate phosphoribosyltransferase
MNNPINVERIREIATKRFMLKRLMMQEGAVMISKEDEPKFRLVSGKESNFYFNCKKVSFHPLGSLLIGAVIQPFIHPSSKGIGGLTLGADPIAYAAMTSKYLDDFNKPDYNGLSAFSIRKERKAHGMGTLVEGNVVKGDRVTIIDDVTTTGGSTIKAIENAKSEGLVIDCVIALVDREEGGLSNIRDYLNSVGLMDTPVFAVFTKAELMEYYKQFELERMMG